SASRRGGAKPDSRACCATPSLHAPMYRGSTKEQPMRLASIALALAIAPVAALAADDAPSATVLRAAAQRGLDLLEKTSPTFVKKGGCNSCHAQMLPAAAQSFARSRGIPTGDTLTQLPAEVSEATAERYVEYSIGGGGGIAAMSFELFAASMARQPADARIRAKIYFIKGMQQPDGSWHGGGSRPPLAFDDFTTTAYMVRALSTYAPAAEAADTAARIERARAWMLASKADRTQERAFQVLGLAWARADRSAIADAARGLQALQRADGGWGQLPAMETDAYATGMALYALFEAGVPTSNASYRTGLNYALSAE